MNANLEDLDLIDLLSERHVLLRNICEQSWNNTSDIYISNSEWYIMARIYKQQPTISYVSKNVDISRQATHKFIKSLEGKGLVAVKNSNINKKEKCLQLTPLGEACYEKNETFKATLEEKIANQLGTEQLLILKHILKSDWGIQN